LVYFLAPPEKRGKNMLFFQAFNCSNANVKKPSKYIHKTIRSIPNMLSHHGTFLTVRKKVIPSNLSWSHGKKQMGKARVRQGLSLPNVGWFPSNKTKKEMQEFYLKHLLDLLQKYEAIS